VIGVVVAEEGARRVLGLTVPLRALLSLQAASVERVLVLGRGAEGVAAQARRDDRVRVPVEVAHAFPAGGALVVGDGVVVEPRTVRALASAGEARVVIAGEVVLAATRADGTTLAALPAGTEVEAGGVAVLARDAGGVRAATRALLASLRKPQDGWISTLLNRHVSLAITRALVWTPVRPNQLSVAIMALGVLGAWLASRGSYAGLAWGGVLFQLQSILDGCDGELSRLTFRGSKLGEWLDTIGDDVTNYGFFLGAALGLHAMGLGTAPLVVGGAGVAIGVVTSGIEYRYLIAIGSGDLLKYPLGFGKDPEPTAMPSPVARALGAIRPAFKRDFFVFLTMLAALAGPGATMAMLVLFLGGALATFGAVLASEIRRARG
jgi:phosphatidylglycerophosphate synthase